MKLITEAPVFTEALIVENKDTHVKNYFIEGIFATSERKNKNGRMYPKTILEREMKKLDEQYVQKKIAYGELEHPQSPVINPERVSHRIIELSESGNDWIGKAVVLNEGKGKIVKSMIDTGGAVAVSTRGLGTLTAKDDVQLVNEDFNLITVDVVLNPSNQTSFVNGVLENIEYVLENGILVAKDISEDDKEIAIQKTEEIIDDLKNETSINLYEKQREAFEKFMDVIKELS